MKTVDDIKGRCVVDTITGCWLWTGATSLEGQARIWQYDCNAEKMAALPGKKAMWYAVNQKPLPEGWRVYGTCNCQTCMNPEHIKAGTTEEWGQHMSASGIHKGNMARIVAARRTGVSRSVMNPEMLHEVRTSKETGRALARRMGISEQTVSKARMGRLIAFSPIASPFAGLGAR